MRIALISPYSIGPIRGNITTIERISRFLRRAGADVLMLPADTLSAAEMAQHLVSFSPHLIHGFHAHYCGGIAQHLAETFNLPLMLTITGSDLHDPLLRDHFVTVRAIEAAQSVVCFGVGEAAKLVSYFPHINERVAVISQGVEVLPVAAADTFGIPDDAFVLLLPAAVRPVKQVEFPLLALKSLVQTFPILRLVLAGGVIDHDYAATIRNMLCDAPYATWLGEVPREQMGALYTRADVVLNCSYSESMSNTVLEAMALGRPMLVNDIPGNRMLISHRDTGLLYKDQDSFLKGVVTLMEDADLRTNIGRRAGEYIQESFSPQHEAAEYMRLYRALTAEGAIHYDR
jgi:glycosyltransferase involved in cell wall biosynthesis